MYIMKKDYLKDDTAKKKYIKKFAKKIVKHNNDLWKPDLNIKTSSSLANSWFTIWRGSCKHKNQINIDLSIDYKYESRKCIKIDIGLNIKQQLIVLKWFNAYTKMYNASLKMIKSLIKEHKSTKFIKIDKEYANKRAAKNAKKDTTNVSDNIKPKKSKINGDEISIDILNFHDLHTHYMKNIKQIIINSLGDNPIPSHTLDAAMKQACAHYKSALTNYKNGNIKQFRIRYWRPGRPTQVMEIEPCYFSKKINGFCPTILGEINATYQNKPFDLKLIRNNPDYYVACNLKYDVKLNKFNLFIPIKCSLPYNMNGNDFISLDPGIRTFMTGISENTCLEIGSNISPTIIRYLRTIDTLNNIKEAEFKCKKMFKTDIEKIRYFEKWKELRINRCYRKISNYVDELHWKTINYLTSRYRNILIGDMSVKGITVKKYGNKMSKIVKRVAYLLKFYKFKERLENKCKSKLIGYKEIDESYTSKICSNCGNIHDDLGSKKIYECSKCSIKIDRDINGARNIYTKSYM